MKKLIFLALFVCVLSGLNLVVFVSDSQQTPLIGSEVKIYKTDQLIESKTTTEFQRYGEKRKAAASFSLDPGVYFIRVQRNYYKENVQIIELREDKEIELILLKDAATYTLYGIIENVTDLEGKTIYAIDENGKTASKSKIFPGGYFLVNYLYPDKKYRLALLDIENKKFGPYFSYPEPKAYFVKLDLEEEKNFQTSQIEFFGPQKVEVPSKIELILKEGQKPLVGKEVLVILPNGKNISLVSDENGALGLNAVEQGRYIFKYENYTFVVNAYKVQIQQEEINKSLISDTAMQENEDNAIEKEQTYQQSDQQSIENIKQQKYKQSQVEKDVDKLIFLILFTVLSAALVFFLIYILLTANKK